jgi:hypothetical protein
MALRNISQNLNVGDSLQPHFLKSSIKGSIQLSIADVATFLVSLVLGFGGNVTASSDKSDQRLSGNDFIKSFSLHQLKKADNHDTLNASYANAKALVARLNSLPFSI